MRIKHIHIDGFGCYSDKSFGPFDEPLAIFFGPNEAGKTTFLEFIRMVLFGFPLRLSAEHFPPLAGGKHGGRLEVVTDAGKSLTIIRHQGKKEGPVIIMGADGTPVPQAALSALLGHVTKTTFESVFAFDLDDLQQLKSDINPTSVGTVRLLPALKQLRERADELYKPGGRLQPVAKVLTELQNVENELGEVRSQAEDYRRAVSQTDELARKGRALEEEVSTVRSRKEELGRRQQAWSDWSALQEVEESLSKIPDRPNFPDDPIGRLDAFEKQCEDADEGVVRKRGELERVRKTAACSVGGEGLLGEGTAVEEIRRRSSSFDASVRDLPKRKSDLSGYRDELMQALKDLGPGWDDRRLDTFDLSLPRRDEIKQWKTHLSSASVELRDYIRDAGQKKQAVDEADQQVQDAQDRVQASPSSQFSRDVLSRQRSALRTARTRRYEFVQADTLRRDLEKQVSGERESRSGFRRFVLSAALGGLGVLFVGVGVAADREVTVLLMGAALMVAAAAAYAYARGMLPGTTRTESRNLGGLIQEARRDAGEKEAKYVASLEPLKPHLESEQLPGSDKLDAVETAIDRGEELNRGRAAFVKAHDAAKRGADRARRDCEKAERQRDEQHKTDRKAKAGWSDWLTQRGLSETLLPDTVTEMFSRADTARVHQRAIVEMEKRIKAIEENIDTYSSNVKAVAARHLDSSVVADGSATVVAQVADRILELEKRAQSAVGEREEAKRTAAKYEKDLAEATIRQATARKRLCDLLSQAETDSPEKFRIRAKQHLERQGLEVKRTEHAAALLAIWGRERELEVLSNAFASTTKQKTDDELQQVESTLKDLNACISKNREGKGRLTERTESLLNDDDASRHHGRRWELIEQLRELATAWSKVTLTESLLVRARAKHEEESQPDVVRHAKKVFSDLTCGRYPKLRVPIGEQTITVYEGETGRWKRPNRLSRGTREQLYLAVRFGFIQHMAEQAERLPLIVDEVLVNYDLERARRAASAFVERSRGNQVIILTCHQWMVDLFTGLAPEAPVVDVSA